MATILGSVLRAPGARCLERPSTSNQIDDQDNDCDCEQQVDQSAANVAEKTKKPENDENYKYGPQHNFILFRLIALGGTCSSNACSPLNALQALNFLSELFLGFAES